MKNKIIGSILIIYLAALSFHLFYSEGILMKELLSHEEKKNITKQVNEINKIRSEIDAKINLLKSSQIKTTEEKYKTITVIEKNSDKLSRQFRAIEWILRNEE